MPSSRRARPASEGPCRYCRSSRVAVAARFEALISWRLDDELTLLSHRIRPRSDELPGRFALLLELASIARWTLDQLEQGFTVEARTADGKHVETFQPSAGLRQAVDWQARRLVNQNSNK